MGNNNCLCNNIVFLQSISLNLESRPGGSRGGFFIKQLKMTYQECESLINDHLAAFQRERFFAVNGITAEWYGLIIAPEGATEIQKEHIFVSCTQEGLDNKTLLLEMGLWHEEQRAFIIYKQKGYMIIRPFQAFLDASNNES